MRLSQARHFIAAAFVLAAATGLSACASTGGGGAPMGAPEEQLVWVRTDGQSGKANPALADQFVQDRATCMPGGAANNAALQAAAPCMQARGYVLVPASQAEATAARFRAQTAQRFPPTSGAH
ncbi:MAG: hypothetical protein J0H94_19250 [Rhizobiales bacterium]|nr:hypothetical protein [Hyphomicrobiales bacterium]